MPTYETLLADAARLPVEDRLRLLDGIWGRLPNDALPPLREEWTAEIRRCSAEYDAGKVQTVSWEEIKADALRRVGLAAPDAAD